MSNKQIESIMENFVKNELSSTETRIGAICIFMDRLKSELIVYAANIPSEPEEQAHFRTILEMFRNMISTYDEEIKLLIKKRDRLLVHLSEIRVVAPLLRPMPVRGNYKIN